MRTRGMTMFLVIGNEFADGELAILCDLFDMIDEKLVEIGRLIKKSKDPESDGLLDRGEYFIGVGFVAIQRYLIETILFTGLEKREAYSLGPTHSSGATYIGLINSCANWWKHEPEWYNNKTVPKNGEQSFINITNIAEHPSYELSNVLSSLCGTNKVSFNSIVPYIKEWRAEVYKSRKKPDR